MVWLNHTNSKNYNVHSKADCGIKNRTGKKMETENENIKKNERVNNSACASGYIVIRGNK